MSPLWNRKGLGMEVGAWGITMALASGNDRSLTLESSQAVPFPAETLRLSRRDPNVLDPGAFVATLREAHQRLLTRDRAVAVALPDAVGRVVLLDLETRFKSREEGMDIIRWKLKKSVPYDISGVHLDYQTIAVKESGAVSLLVSLITRSVVTQYEELIVEAGLEPKIIDFTSFNLYRLFAHRLEMSDDCAFVSFYRGAMNMLIFHGGVLSFYRAKELVDDEQALFREVNSSLLVYRDSHPGQTVGEIFCMAEASDAEAFRMVVAEASGLEPVILDLGRMVAPKNGLSVDRDALYALSGALGAALRSL